MVVISDVDVHHTRLFSQLLMTFKTSETEKFYISLGHDSALADNCFVDLGQLRWDY